MMNAIEESMKVVIESADIEEVRNLATIALSKLESLEASLGQTRLGMLEDEDVDQDTVEVFYNNVYKRYNESNINLAIAILAKLLGGGLDTEG